MTRENANNGRVQSWSRRKMLQVIVLMAALAPAGVAGAHHSYAMFDMTKTVTFEGTVKDFEWTNPHVWIEVMVETPEGLKEYGIEGNNPRTMIHAGWKFNTVKPGDKVTVELHPLRDGRRGGSLSTVKLPDGRTLHEH